jgi:hypothetical protein
MCVLIVYPDGARLLVKVRTADDGHAMVRRCERLGCSASLLTSAY